jgi:hypothetical protein
MNAPLLTLGDVIKNAINNGLESVHTCIPGKIVSFDNVKCLANVKPSISYVSSSGEVLAMPTVYNVPVVFSRTQNTAITFPIENGDGVLLIFSERSLDAWMLSNGSDVDPKDDRRFDLTDAIAIPGLFPSGKGKAVSSNTGLSIQYKNATITIDNSGQVNINDGNLTVDL